MAGTRKPADRPVRRRHLDGRLEEQVLIFAYELLCPLARRPASRTLAKPSSPDDANQQTVIAKGA